MQNVIGLVPTALAIGGWLVLLALALRRRDPPRLLVSLLPLAGLAGYLYFTVSYPTPDGDVLKPTYMLTTHRRVGAVLRLGGDDAGRAVAAARRRGAVALALLDLPFVIYKGGVGF